MLKIVAVRPDAHQKPILILGITAADYGQFVAGASVTIDPAAVGLPGAAFTIFVLGDTTEERLIQRITGDGAEITQAKNPAEAAEFVKEHVYGKTTH